MISNTHPVFLFFHIYYVLFTCLIISDRDNCLEATIAGGGGGGGSGGHNTSLHDVDNPPRPAILIDDKELLSSIVDMEVSEAPCPVWCVVPWYGGHSPIPWLWEWLVCPICDAGCGGGCGRVCCIPRFIFPDGREWLASPDASFEHELPTKLLLLWTAELEDGTALNALWLVLADTGLWVLFCEDPLFPTRDCPKGHLKAQSSLKSYAKHLFQCVGINNCR